MLALLCRLRLYAAGGAACVPAQGSNQVEAQVLAGVGGCGAMGEEWQRGGENAAAIWEEKSVRH